MNRVPPEILHTLGMRPLPGARLLGGGRGRQVAQFRLTGGKSVVVKRSPGAEEGYFAAEAAGLEALTAAAKGLRLRAARVLYHQRDCIVLEGIEEGSPGGEFWRHFGRDLARLHQRGEVDGYGLDADNFIGSRRQSNGRMDNWGNFFWHRRLWPRLEQLWPQLSGGERLQAERLAKRIGDLLPARPHPALLHGDLWSGNYLVGSDGEPVLIDPAVYYGHSEADVAMTRLFGGFGADFYRGYAAVLPRLGGDEERMEVYNLYHLCNHWLSFGGSYRAAVLRILRRFGR